MHRVGLLRSRVLRGEATETGAATLQSRRVTGVLRVVWLAGDVTYRRERESSSLTGICGIRPIVVRLRIGAGDSDRCSNQDASEPQRHNVRTRSHLDRVLSRGGIGANVEASRNGLATIR